MTVEDEEEEPTDTEEDLDDAIEKIKLECGYNRTWPNETEEQPFFPFSPNADVFVFTEQQHIAERQDEDTIVVSMALKRRWSRENVS